MVHMKICCFLQSREFPAQVQPQPQDDRHDVYESTMDDVAIVHANHMGQCRPCERTSNARDTGNPLGRTADVKEISTQHLEQLNSSR